MTHWNDAELVIAEDVYKELGEFQGDDIYEVVHDRLVATGSELTYSDVLQRYASRIKRWEPAEVESLKMLFRMYPEEPRIRIMEKYQSFFAVNWRSISALQTTMHRFLGRSPKTFPQHVVSSARVLEQSRRLTVEISKDLEMDPPSFDNHASDEMKEVAQGGRENELVSTEEDEICVANLIMLHDGPARELAISSQSVPTERSRSDDDNTGTCSETDEGVHAIPRTPRPSERSWDKCPSTRREHRCQRCATGHRGCTPCPKCNDPPCRLCSRCCKRGPFTDCNAKFAFGSSVRLENEESPTEPLEGLEEEGEGGEGEDDPATSPSVSQIEDVPGPTTSSSDVATGEKRYAPSVDKIALAKEGVRKPTNTRRATRRGAIYGERLMDEINRLCRSDTDEGEEDQTMSVAIEGYISPSEVMVECPIRNCGLKFFFQKGAMFVRCPRCRAEYSSELIKITELPPLE